LDGLKIILKEEVVSGFGSFVDADAQTSLSGKLFRTMEQTFDKTTVMDSADQMQAIAASTTPVILDLFSGVERSDAFGPSLSTLSDFRSRVATKATALYEKLRREYLSGSRGPTPAIAKLGKTRGMYSYIRKNLAIKMHGTENFTHFPNGIGIDDVSAGENISKIYEVSKQPSTSFYVRGSDEHDQAIRDGHMQDVVFSIFV
jgi:phenylalanine ammonia-lyase